MAAAKSSGEVVARVGNNDVTADDMRNFIATLSPQQQAAVAQDPSLLSQAVRMMLSNRLVMQELAAKKWDKQPQIEAQLRKGARKRAGRALSAVGVEPAGEFPERRRSAEGL
ncbi:hypothetical protein ACVOMS_34915 [Bradyrhizobium guangxiense]